MTKACPVCGNTDNEFRAVYRGLHSIFAGMQLEHCNHCGMIFANPMPGKKALKDYNTSYFESAHGGIPQNKISTAFFSAIARLRIAYIEHYLDKQSLNVLRLLELGPGPGFFASNWLMRHPLTYYQAIETDRSCHDSLQKQGVHLLEKMSNDNAAEPVDLIVMSHILEHVSEPRAFLADVCGNLRRDGVLFIEVPCRDWEHKNQDEPHLLFFDKEPMLYMLEKSGFENIQINYYGQEIDKLRSNSFLENKLKAIRSKLISLGLIRPFSQRHQGMELLDDPLERAVIAPFKAHCESSRPAWWLRAIATKQ